MRKARGLLLAFLLVGACARTAQLPSSAHEAELARTTSDGFRQAVERFLDVCVFRDLAAEPIEADPALTVVGTQRIPGLSGNSPETIAVDAISKDGTYSLSAYSGNDAETSQRINNCNMYLNTFPYYDTDVASELDAALRKHAERLPPFRRRDGTLMGTVWQVGKTSGPLISIGRSRGSARLRLIYIGSPQVR